jgi:hypothetical protein
LAGAPYRISTTPSISLSEAPVVSSASRSTPSRDSKMSRVQYSPSSVLTCNRSRSYAGPAKTAFVAECRLRSAQASLFSAEQIIIWRVRSDWIVMAVSVPNATLTDGTTMPFVTGSRSKTREAPPSTRYHVRPEIMSRASW